MKKTITILLATYNGEKYLSHQLDSIINQTYTNWQLIIRDDGSNDDTITIIQKYKEQYPDKITALENGSKNKGALYNFNALLQAARKAEYIMFCDQDDEWKRDKIEISYATMKALEKQLGNHYPILIYTNFQYVDENMQVIASKQNFEINRIDNFGFAQLLVQNPVYGCTTLINRALAEKVGCIPPEADIHDHWIALVAAAFGKLFYLQEKTVLYRQHEKNVSGNWDNDSFTKRFQRIVLNKKNFTQAKIKYKMLMAFREKYTLVLDKKLKSILNNFLSLFTNKNPFHFLKSIRNGIRSQTIAQSILLYITILFIKKPSQT